MVTVALESLGCKLNQAEIEEIARGLAEAGYRIVGPDEQADIYVLNTCTVTHVADHKSRQMLRAARRRNPSGIVVAVGCYAERAPQELEKTAGVDLVVPNSRKDSLVALLGAVLPPSAAPVPGPYRMRRSRAFVRVQEGCQNFCSYCIVPYVRSNVRSVPADEVLARVKERVALGYQEVVLTGTEIGDYDDSRVDLAGLLQRILDGTEVKRLRISSLQPHHISDRLLALFRDGRLCPHFHLSLQSGSDGVLGRMKRRYSVAGYFRAVEAIRGAVDDVAITTDVIVGFPGETDAEFEETVAFLH
ncbi:MAG: MiaB/RimO family radical SAM methylthiotransferase, partial [Dehalococcoidales bacterium]|nr:MiaB/RimO family radical SAM methylthiotransferase [Dehalococcoidales bacterium]